MAFLGDRDLFRPRIALADVLETEISGGELILAFDGRVLEVFGAYSQHAASLRYHVRQLIVRVQGPDRKGRREVTLKGRTPQLSPTYELDGEAEWEAMWPLLEALRAAGATFENT